MLPHFSAEAALIDSQRPVVGAPTFLAAVLLFVCFVA
jgi:hypothetical protein